MRRRTIASEAASRPYGTADKPDDAHMAPRRTRPTPGDLDAAAKDRGSAGGCDGSRDSSAAPGLSDRSARVTRLAAPDQCRMSS
jgi:hypothetical protein